MGIDCMLFAVRAKKCIWTDRRHNIPAPIGERFSGDWWLGYLAGLDEATRSGGLWQSNDGSVSECGWAGDSALANREFARQFIKRHGADDQYFLVSDHDEPSCHDVAQRDGYARD